MLLIKAGIPGDMIQSQRFLFADSNNTYVPDFFKLHAVLPGYLASVCPPSTILTNRSSTFSRSDLVLVSNNSICLFELTIPTNTQQHLLAARVWKGDWYSSLQYDLQLSGLSVNLISIEIGCLSHFMSGTIVQVASTCEMTKKTVRSPV